MAKKYYSDVTKKIYDDELELEKDEKAAEEKKALALKEKEELALARKEAAKEIETATTKVNDAYKALKEAQNELYEKKKAFIDKYGSYHYSTTNPEDPAFKYSNNFIAQTIKEMDEIFKPFRLF